MDSLTMTQTTNVGVIAEIVVIATIALGNALIVKTTIVTIVIAIQAKRTIVPIVEL